MDGLIEWQIRQADAVGFPVAFLSNVPPPEIEDPSFQRERGVFASRLLTCIADAGPYRNAQGDEPRQAGGR
jgi:hypothetical protein